MRNSQTQNQNMAKETKGSKDWDERFNCATYAYGEAPNDFLVWAAPQVKVGKALSLCEGEGRNAVYLAKMGFQVTAVDFSRVGLEKARALAAKHHVTLECMVMDLNDFSFQPNAWDLVVSVFSQPNSAVRKRLYAQLATTLNPGGAFVLEAKVADDPSSENRYPGTDVLRQEIDPLQVTFAKQAWRELSEGPYHLGLHHTAQLLAVRR